jgi:hypothetical protein
VRALIPPVARLLEFYKMIVKQTRERDLCVRRDAYFPRGIWWAGPARIAGLGQSWWYALARLGIRRCIVR